MFIRKDITDLNPNEILHQMANELINYTVNDRILTSAEKLIGGDKNDLDPWDIDLFDPVPNMDDTTITVDKKVVDVDDDEFHGDNVEWW